MANYNCNQPYYNPAAVPGWATKDSSRMGWLPWTPGGGGGPVVKLYYMNKVWDPYGSGQWVSWETEDNPDPSGTFYPDPYGSGFGACTFYRVQGMRWA